MRGIENNLTPSQKGGSSDPKEKPGQKQETTEEFSFPVDNNKLPRIRNMEDVVGAIGGNEKADLDCICKILGGTQKLDESYMFENASGQKVKAETALDYLYYQGSLDALEIAAEKVGGWSFSENLPKGFNNVDSYEKHRENMEEINAKDDDTELRHGDVIYPPKKDDDENRR